MYVPFEEMAKSSRIWIYQANRPLSEDETRITQEISRPFLDQWAAHGKPLKSSLKLVHQRFLIIAVDESYNEASGCSIDASVSLIKKLETEFQIDFFDRTQVLFLVNDQAFSRSLKDMKSLVESGTIEKKTLTFNNLVTNVEQLENSWMIPAADSWLKRFFK